MAVAVKITKTDMVEFLSTKGFLEIKLPGTKEMVMGKVVDHTYGREICLRVYTSIEGEISRDVGDDAIRVVLVTRVGGTVTTPDIKIIGSDKRVHRVQGWKTNLASRIENWREQLGIPCPKCGRVTVRRFSRRGPFWGCSAYPACRGIVPIVLPKKRPVSTEWQMDNQFQQHEIAEERKAYESKMRRDESLEGFGEQFLEGEE